jgi:molybdopterin-containing oxidoreductase family membrane subunit
VRDNVFFLWVIALVINVGMWLERFVIIVVSLHRDFLPSSWDMYYPTVWDWMTYAGTIGLFLALLFLFIRALPVISIFEMRSLVSKAEERA